ncbi:MAG: beta strand repeat-containing protein [Thermoguttaceae bacterium]
MSCFTVSRLRCRSLLLLASFFAMLAFLSASSALAQVVWTNSGMDSWNNPANWAGGAVPVPVSGGYVIPWVSSGGTAVIDTAGTYGAFQELWTGNGNGNGNVIQSDGTTVNVQYWFEVGRMYAYTGPQVSAADNVSSYTMNGASIVNTGNAEIGGGWYDQTNGLSNSTGILTLNDSAQFTAGGFVTLGQWNAGGAGILNLHSNAVFSVNGGWLDVGTNGSSGAVNIDGNAVINVNIANKIDIADGGDSSGTLNQTSGTINGSGEVWVGNNHGNGTYNMAGGLLNTGDWLFVGRNATGVFNMNGGTVNTRGHNLGIGGTGSAGNGTWNQNAGLVLATGGIVLAWDWGGGPAQVGTINLSGGTIQAPWAATWASSGNGTGTLYFNGGVLQASTNNGDFLTTNNNYVQAGGAIIDTNGYNIAFNTGLVPDPALGGAIDGGLTKNGAGTLALNGTSTTTGAPTPVPSSYTGPTLVNAGTLLITGSLTTTSGIHVKSGATLGGDGPVSAVVLDAGATLAPGYTFANPSQVGVFQPASLSSTGGILAFKLSNSTDTGNDQIQVAGNLSLSNVAINISSLLNNSLASGTYDLVSAPASTGAVSGLTLTGLPVSRQTYSLSYSNTAVDLNVSAAMAANLVWTGNVSNVWNVKTTQNWYNVGSGTADVFYNLDNVTFNDSGSSNGVVNIATNVVPGSVTFSMTSAASAYTLSGTGGITGTTGLVMSGAGTLTVATPNSYTGETDIHGGTVVVTAGGALGDQTTNYNATYISPNAGETASVILSGGTLGGSTVGIGGDGTAALTMSGNSVLNAGAGGLLLASGTAGLGQGSVSQSGNSVVNIGGGGALNIGVTGTGSYSITDSAKLNVASFIYVGSGGPGTMTISGSSVVTAGSNSATNDIEVGNTAGMNGTLNISGGTLNTSGEIWLSSVSGAQGVMNMSGGVVNIGSWLAVGRGGDNGNLYVSGGSLTVGASTGNNLTIASFVGNQGQVTITGGTVNSLNSIWVGETGTGTMTISGNSVVSASGPSNQGGNILVGKNTGSIGSLSITSGTLSAGSDSGLMVWDGSGTITIGTPPLSGDGAISPLGVAQNPLPVVTAGWITLGQDNGIGTLTQYDGAVTTTHDNLWIGYGAAGAQGTYNLYGGTLTTAGDIRTDSGTGYMNQYGGSATVGGWLRLGINAGSSSSYSLTGGTLNVNGAQVNVGENGSGSLSIGGSSGTMVVAAGSTLTIANGIGTGILTLQDGGLLRTPNITAGTAGTATFNWTGGTLQNAPNGGLDVTVPVSLNGPGTVAIDLAQIGTFEAAGAISGLGGLTMVGPGKLILAGSDTYMGGTTVAAGTLVLTSSSAVVEGSELTVGANASSIFSGAAAAQAASRVSAVPEPGTLALLIAGLAVGFGAWRQRKVRH